jgi:hypothetical protein
MSRLTEAKRLTAVFARTVYIKGRLSAARFRGRATFATILTAVVLAIAPTGRGQTLERSVVSAGGGTAVAGNVCLSFTIGEAVADSGAAPALTTGFQQPTGYDLWSGSHSLTSGPGEDADGDRLSNLLEFAFGTDPLSSASVVAPVLSAGMPGLPVLSISKGTTSPDLNWSGETSTDLQLWSNTGFTVLVNDNLNFSVQFTGNEPARCIRIRLSVVGAK